jgi:hypothetical protein
MRMNHASASRHALGAIFLLSVTGCTHDAGPAAPGSNAGDTNGGAPSAGASGSSGRSSGGNANSAGVSGGDTSDAGRSSAGAGRGGANSGGTTTAGTNMGGVNQGGSSGAGANSGGMAPGGTNGGGSISVGGAPSGDWIDVSPKDSAQNCSGVVVNRLTGEVLTDVTDQGVWRSVNQGADWERVDAGTVGGLIVLGPGFDVDQNDPKRVAAWSLDGDAGWTSDGVTWKKMKSVGRNWDFGSTDWNSPDPQTLMATRHEANGEVYLSTDGAATWNLMTIKVFASGVAFPPPAFAMVGVMDEKTLIYGDGDGILRSTNTGESFTKVSDLNARTRVPVLFKEVFYLGGDSLLVSTDKGASWQPQGAALEIWVGPYFGDDENHMMVANKQGVYLTSDAGANFTKVASLPADPQYDPQIWGGYAWDPKGGFLYAAAVGKPLLQLRLD